MKIIILSGKGGTGKSSITASIACELKDRFVLVDADSDCPNQHLLFPGEIIKQQELNLTETSIISKDYSSSIKTLDDLCRFGAIFEKKGRLGVDKRKCTGCGNCIITRSAGSAILVPKRTGELIVIETKKFSLVYGRLEPGESGSGKMVFEIKKTADELGRKNSTNLILIDAPAGIGCPVIAAVTGCDYALGVVEPTPASIANLERALEVVKHFNIPFSVIMNKSGLSKKYEKEINRKFGNAIIATIPYDEELPHLLARGVPPVKGNGKAAVALKELVKKVELEIIGGKQ